MILLVSSFWFNHHKMISIDPNLEQIKGVRHLLQIKSSKSNLNTKQLIEKTGKVSLQSNHTKTQLSHMMTNRITWVQILHISHQKIIQILSIIRQNQRKKLKAYTLHPFQRRQLSQDPQLSISKKHFKIIRMKVYRRCRKTNLKIILTVNHNLNEKRCFH